MGNLLSRVLSGGSDAECVVVPGWKLPYAALPSACASRRGALRGWGPRCWRKWLSDAVCELRNYHRLPGMVWRNWLLAHPLFLVGGGGSFGAGLRCRTCGRDDRVLVCGEAAA